MNAEATLLEVRDLKVHFETRTWLGRPHVVKAVDGVSLEIRAGESVGLVGESGSGKTTVANAIVGLAPVTGGSVRFRGRDQQNFAREDWKAFREHVQMVFQDPFGSLNPRLTAGGCIAEVLKVHAERARSLEGQGGTGQKGSRADRVVELLNSVGLDADFASRYPHELSGGQRQRIGIARALAGNPSVLIADEPVSALDVSVQAQILDLMGHLRQRLGIAYLLISHDLAVVHDMCETVLVMHRGKIVESGTREEVLLRPVHAYTKALLAAVPDIDKGLERRRSG